MFKFSGGVTVHDKCAFRSQSNCTYVQTKFQQAKNTVQTNLRRKEQKFLMKNETEIEIDMCMAYACYDILHHAKITCLLIVPSVYLVGSLFHTRFLTSHIRGETEKAKPREHIKGCPIEIKTTFNNMKSIFPSKK